VLGDDEEEASVEVGGSNATATGKAGREGGGKKKGNEINNFLEFKVFCRRHFSTLVGRPDEKGERALVFPPLFRENEIDPLHSGLEENRNPPPAFTRQFSLALLTFLLRSLR